MKRLFFSIIFPLYFQLLPARTIYVDTGGNDANNGLSETQAFATMEKAFLALADRDTVRVGEGTFTTTKTLEWGNKSICVIGSGAEKTVVRAAENPVTDINSVYTYSVFYNMKSVDCANTEYHSAISELTIANGVAPVGETMPTGVGGGIKNFAHLTLSNCVIVNNTALNGGGVYNAGTLVLDNCTVRGNHAFNSEGGVFNTRNATFIEKGTNVMERNTADELYNTTVSICDFESGFFGRKGTNGNAEGGYIEDSPMFTIEDNPDKTGLNPTDKVAKFKRLKAGNWWAYAWLEFPPCDIKVVPRYLHIMVRKSITSRVCIQVKDRHNNPVANTGELLSDAQTLTNEWEDLVFEIPNTGSYCYLEIKPDFVNTPPNSRLPGDIDIYFDEIIIDGSPLPRTIQTGTVPLGRFDFPKEQADLNPTYTNEHVELSELTYTGNLQYDYNSTLGYFRPWGWPAGDKDNETYLEFSLAPKDGYSVCVEQVKMVHKPNTLSLGPSEFEIMYSPDNGESFASLYKETFTNRGAFTTHVAKTDEINTSGHVVFRLHAFSSLHGTAAQKDFWIIDCIELSGKTEKNNTTGLAQTRDEKDMPSCYSDPSGWLHITNVSTATDVRLFDLRGTLLLSRKVWNDTILPFRLSGEVCILQMKTQNNVCTQKLTGHPVF